MPTPRPTARPVGLPAVAVEDGETGSWVSDGALVTDAVVRCELTVVAVGDGRDAAKDEEVTRHGRGIQALRGLLAAAATQRENRSAPAFLVVGANWREECCEVA